MKDYVGAFAVTAGIGIEKKLAEFEAKKDDYSAIMLKALADRLAEAFAEWLHMKVRREFWGYARNEQLDNAALIREEYQGIRPAPGYPACPDHTAKAGLFDLLQARKIGMTLTESYAMIAKGLANGDAVPAAAAVGLAAVVLILVLQRWLPKIPAVLIAVVLAIAATTVFSLADHGVSLVGVLPKGFPPLTIPHVRLSDLGPLFAGALGIALVSLADTISTASAFAARSGQEVRGNGEMIGIGAANLAAGLFQGFPVSTSGSRTAVAERSGAKTQLTGVTGAALIILMIVLVPGLFRNLPQPALAAVVITASLSLADIPATVRLWRQRKAEFLAVDRGVRWRRPARRAARDRDRGRPVDPERLPPRVVAL